MSLTCMPYISFPGNATEVLEYWKELFGGELHLMTYGAMQLEDLPFEPPETAVAHAVLNAPGLAISGGDGMGQDLPSLESGVYSFLLSFDTVEEGRAMFDRLGSADGQVQMPFEVAPWGDHYGQVCDRYGVLWSISVETSRH